MTAKLQINKISFRHIMEKFWKWKNYDSEYLFLENIL